MITEKEILEILNTKLPNWKLIDSKIVKFIERQNGKELGGIVKKIWDFAEEVDHHPDILLTYSGIKITLFTHDKSGITTKDIDFALALEGVIN